MISGVVGWGYLHVAFWLGRGGGFFGELISTNGVGLPDSICICDRQACCICDMQDLYKGSS